VPEVRVFSEISTGMLACGRISERLPEAAGPTAGGCRKLAREGVQTNLSVERVFLFPIPCSLLHNFTFSLFIFKTLLLII
jgi:hypothetical protein